MTVAVVGQLFDEFKSVDMGGPAIHQLLAESIWLHTDMVKFSWHTGILVQSVLVM